MFLAEFPNTKEKPKTMVAKGIKELMSLLPLKISRQTNRMMISATQINTASNLETADDMSLSDAERALRSR